MGDIMFQTVVFALSEDNAREAILRLQSEGYVQIVEWLGSDKGNGVITHDYGSVFDVNVLREYYQPCPKQIYDKIHRKLYIFLDMVHRTGESSIYEDVNLFNLYVGYYYGMFTQRKVNLLIFGDVPHFGVDSIAKDVANAMGIKCILFQQSMENNHFFAFLDINDIGIYDSIPNAGSVSVKLDGKSEKDLYYMKDIHVYEPGRNDAFVQTFDKVSRQIKKHRRHLLFKAQEMGCRILTTKLSGWIKRKKYRQCVKQALKDTAVDFNVRYVYFPLHLQPEMTTSVLGCEYCDQILAIERLVQMIPADWKIYVKENPKQSYYMREPLFFRRLQLLPQVRFVGREINTYDLIRHSQFVATITGTAGWEAVSGGKPALVFGLAWYRKFPGVFEYKDNPSLNDIVQCQIDIREVEAAYNRLHSKAYPGVLELGQEKRIKNYSHERNNELLYDAFVRILSLLREKDR